MVRLVLVVVPLFIVAAASSAAADVKPGDFECTPCGERCEAMGLDAGDRICSGPSSIEAPAAGDRHLLGVYGLASPPMAGLPSLVPQAGTPVIRIHEPDASSGTPVGTDPGVIQYHRDPIPVGDDDRPPAAEDEQPVIRVHEDEPDTVAAGEVTTEDGERILRIHEDDEDVDGDNDEVIEINQDDEVDQDADDDREEPVEFTTGYVDWEFTPVIEVVETDGAVTDVDAQQTVDADSEAITDCFEPMSYPGEGTVDVDLHLSYNGIVQAVNGTTDGVRPNQARCILERAWRYQFPRVAGDADEASNVQYRIRFVGQTVDVPAAEANRAQFFVERLRTDAPALDASIASGLVDNLESAGRCAEASLDELPSDFVATEVRANWHRTDDGRYRPAQLDITVTNKTGSELPSAEVVNCYEQAFKNWRIDLDDADELPDSFSSSFFVTLRPAGWHGA